MGSSISTVQGDIPKVASAKDKEAEIKEALDNMYYMASDQLEMFNERIRNKDLDDHLIPIKKILNSYDYIQCTSAINNTIDIGIRGAVNDFAHGSAADGLVDLATDIIVKMTNESTGTRLMKTTYAISVDPLGGISRLDTFFFVYNFSSKGLGDTAKSLVACAIVKSSADVKEVDDNTLRVLINDCFGLSELNVRKAIYAELQEALFERNSIEYRNGLNKIREFPDVKTALSTFAAKRPAKSSKKKGSQGEGKEQKEEQKEEKKEEKKAEGPVKK